MALSAKSFGKIIDKSIPAVIKAFVQRSKIEVPGAAGRSDTYIEKHLKQVLTGIAQFLDHEGANNDFLKSVWMANEHGLQRTEGETYTLEDLQKEQLILRQELHKLIPSDESLDSNCVLLFSNIMATVEGKATENFVRNSVAELLERKRQQEFSNNRIGALTEEKNLIGAERDSFVRFFNETPDLICLTRGPDHRLDFLNARG